VWKNYRTRGGKKGPPFLKQSGKGELIEKKGARSKKKEFEGKVGG